MKKISIPRRRDKKNCLFRGGIYGEGGALILGIEASAWQVNPSGEIPQGDEKPEIYCSVYTQEDYVIGEDAKRPPRIGWPFRCIDFIQGVQGPSDPNDG